VLFRCATRRDIALGSSAAAAAPASAGRRGWEISVSIFAVAGSRWLRILIPHAVITVFAVPIALVIVIGGLISPRRYEAFAAGLLDRLIAWRVSAMRQPR